MDSQTQRIGELQGEVARKFASGKADGGPAPERRSLFDLLMPRLAWGAAVVVGLGLAASLMLPRNKSAQQEMYFAKNDRVAVVAADNESKARAAVPLEKVAPAAPRPEPDHSPSRRVRPGAVASPDAGLAAARSR